MTGMEYQNLYNDLTKLSVFIQNYITQLSKAENVGGTPFEEKLKNFLVPYSDLQISEYMKDPTDEDPKRIPQVAHELMTLLTDPGTPSLEHELYSELKIIHDLLHAPGKLLPDLHSDSIVVKGYNFNLLIKQLTKINLLRHLCQDFAIIDIYRQNNKEFVDQHFPSLKNLSLEWLSVQFNAIKVVAANPHQQVGIPAAISENAFPQVGGIEVQITWQAGQPVVANPLAQANPQAAAAPIDQPKAPVASPIVPQAPIPQPDLAAPRRHPHHVPAHQPARHQRAQAPYARSRRDNNNDLPRVYPPYMPPARRFNAPHSPGNGRFRLFALFACAYLAYHYHSAMTSAISASFAVGKSMATAGIAFLATASWPVLITLSLFSLIVVLKGVNLVANRSHAPAHAKQPISADFEAKLRNHLGQRPLDQQDDIGPQPEMRFSPKRPQQQHRYPETGPNIRNRRGIQV